MRQFAVRAAAATTAVALSLGAHPALANDNARLVGTWRLVAFDTEFQNGEPSRPAFGQKWFALRIRSIRLRTGLSRLSR